MTYKLQVDKIVLNSQAVRHMVRGKKAIRYRTQEYLNFTKDLQLQIMEQEPVITIGGCKVDIQLIYPIPKSRKDLIPCSPKLTSPDVDNCAKSILDAMNGILWEDDKYIYDLRVTKIYGINDKIEISIGVE
jgi:Holliday junction resolvase RusA-like endonuclease